VRFEVDPASLAVGETLGAQIVYRDTHAGGSGFNLSSVMQIVVLT
jgi:hypothetical protein